ncbi:MAG: helix-turn-helix transcriptional regulator [Ignavibacteriales bacterium]|nr:helix-turn-helix transcriptional regulator [Ignavibacteriales bacterium]
MSSVSERLKKIASKEPSKWLEKAKWRVTNEKWLDKSAKIALTILRAIREKGITQKELAEKLNISPQQINKLVKGNENLTLETIYKLEIVLGITLMDIPSLQTTIKSVPEGLYIPPAYKKMSLPSHKLSYKEMQEPITCPDVDGDSNRKKAA